MCTLCGFHEFLASVSLVCEMGAEKELTQKGVCVHSTGDLRAAHSGKPRVTFLRPIHSGSGVDFHALVLVFVFASGIPFSQLFQRRDCLHPGRVSK